MARKTSQMQSSMVGPYEVRAELGKGTTGTVHVAKHCGTREEFAIKRIANARIDDEKIQQEVGNQRRVDHEHVIKIQEVIEEAGDVYIVMELAAGGDLAAYVSKRRRRPEIEARLLFEKIVLGVQHCHDRGVAHRDLKLENIFLDAKGDVKIGDFGLAADMREGELLKGPVGSPHFAAPELLNLDTEYAGRPIDVWSCGVVLYALLCGALPFDDCHLPRLFKSIKKGEYTLPRHLSDHAKDLIAKMLIVDPSERIPMADVLEHEWFKQDLTVSISAATGCGDGLFGAYRQLLALLPLFSS